MDHHSFQRKMIPIDLGAEEKRFWLAGETLKFMFRARAESVLSFLEVRRHRNIAFALGDLLPFSKSKSLSLESGN